MPAEELSRPSSPVSVRVAEIQQRLAKATPGPWTWEDWENEPPQNDDPNECWTLAAPPTARRGGPAKMFPDLGAKVLSCEPYEIDSQADKALIANAPTDLAWALDTIRSLESERDAWKRYAEHRDQCPVCHEWEQPVGEIRQSLCPEGQRLRKATRT